MDSDQSYGFPHFHDGSEEIILQEEIVGEDGTIYDEIPMSDSNAMKIAENIVPLLNDHTMKKATKRPANRRPKPARQEDDTNTRKWAQKQVQIKTMQGEFSVTMWSSGPDGDQESDDDVDKKGDIIPVEELHEDHHGIGMDPTEEVEYMNDYMVEHKIPLDGIPGIDLTDPKQVAEIAKHANRQQIQLQQHQQQLAFQQLEELQKQQYGEEGESPFSNAQLMHIDMNPDQPFLVYAE
ncbi:unnamed protein product [Notodromas monacha]|uniref:Uncharacterized protein n=1 Tax=Notodromas monacha TaxID=399045 RepID=A0A7R9BJ13_9CRUS|nr:unnamed protein product [Notodromas monacha]CAG0916417.1 unnamed protein product [Notodromas monacha]